MSIADPFQTEPRVGIWPDVGVSPIFRLGMKILSAILALGALLALAFSGHALAAAWLGLVFVTWGFFIGAATASSDED